MLRAVRPAPGLGLGVGTPRRRTRVETARAPFGYGAPHAAPGDTPACPRGRSGATSSASAASPARSARRDRRDRHRDACSCPPSAGRDSPVQATAPASASRLLPAGPPIAGDRRAPRHAAPPAADQPDPRDGGRLPGRHRRRARALAARHAGEPGPAEARRAQDLRRRERHAALVPAARRPGPATSALDVGAAPGTDVYSPVDGTIVGIDDVMLNGRTYGSRIDIQPTGAPSLVVGVSHVRVDPSLAVGSPVTAAGSQARRACVDFSPGRAPGALALHERRGQPRRRRGPPRRDALPELVASLVEDPLRRRRVRRARPAGGRDAAAVAARGARRRLLHRQRRERRGRPRDHREARRPDPRERRRRDHARQLGLGPAGLRALPLGHRPRAAARRTCRPSTPGTRARRPRRRRGDQPARRVRARPVRERVHRGRPARRGGARADARDRGRLPRRGDEREGRDGAITSTAA